MRSFLAVGEIDEFDQLIDSPAERFSAQAVHSAEEGEVLAGAEIGIEGDFLGNEAHQALGRHRLFSDGVASDGCVPLGWGHQPADHGDRGGFASAVGAEQAEDFALANFKVHAFDGFYGGAVEAGIGFSQVARLYH